MERSRWSPLRPRPPSWQRQLQAEGRTHGTFCDQQVSVSAAHDVAAARGDGALKVVSAFSLRFTFD